MKVVFVKRTRKKSGPYYVSLDIYHQSFMVGPYWDTKTEANWYANNLRVALKKIVAPIKEAPDARL